jgi:hypothetical protein
MLYQAEYNELVSLLKAGEIRSYDVHQLKMMATDDQLISSHKEAGVEQELTDRDMDVQDETDGIIFDMYRDLTGNEPEWDVAVIGDLRDDIVERIARETKRTEYSFHPYMVSDDKGSPPTFQSINSILEHQLRNEPLALEEFESLLSIVASDEDYETEQDAINHLIDIAEMELDNWRILRMACGPRR